MYPLELAAFWRKLSALTAAPEGETNIAVLKDLYRAAFTYQFEILFISTALCIILYAVIKFLLRDAENA